MIGYGGVRRGCVQTSAGLKHDCTQWGQLVRVRISGLGLVDQFTLVSWPLVGCRCGGQEEGMGDQRW